MEIDAKKIGALLTKLRGERTQEEVARAVGISVSALSMYETGNRIPRDNIKIRLSAYYGQPIHKIFYNQISQNVSEISQSDSKKGA